MFGESMSNEQLRLFQPSPFEIQPVTPQLQRYRDWEITINREEVTGEVYEAVLSNPHIGVELTYGMRPEGYDGITIRERGGGGAVSIPWMKDPETGNIYIGLVEERRSTLGDKTWNVPRGYLDPEEDHSHAAPRELNEETGYQAFASRTTKIADGLNPNSAYFNTSGINPDGTKEGIAIYSTEVYQDELEISLMEDGSISYIFPRDVQDRVQDEPNEHILATRFVPIELAMKSKDMFTSAAAGQLLVAFQDGTLKRGVRKMSWVLPDIVTSGDAIPNKALQYKASGISGFTPYNL